MPIISSGAVSPSARAMPMIVPVSMPGIASGSTWWDTIWIFEAPMPSAASRIDGGHRLQRGTRGDDDGGQRQQSEHEAADHGRRTRQTEDVQEHREASRPNTMDGTAARLLMFTSMMSVQRFLGANSSR